VATGYFRLPGWASFGDIAETKKRNGRKVTQQSPGF
jgi:hypothetical protein